jgi:hypothetical protein
MIRTSSDTKLCLRFAWELSDGDLIRYDFEGNWLPRFDGFTICIGRKTLCYIQFIWQHTCVVYILDEAVCKLMPR